MREIKFRAWDIVNKRMFVPRKMEFVPKTGVWLNSENITLDIGCTVVYFDAKPLEWAEKYFELMQFTGLKDKNGKEIYEGDLIRYAGDDGVYFEVFYNQDSARFSMCRTHYQGNRCGAYIPEITSIVNEVIGNIHENKELIEKWNQ